MTVYSLIPLVASLTNLFLVILVYFRAKKDAARIAFIFGGLSVFTWNMGAFLSFLASNPKIAALACRINGTGLVFIPSLTYLFSLSITESEGAARQRFKIAGLLISAAFLPFIWFTKLFFSDIYYHSWGWYPQIGPAGVFFNFFLLFFGYDSLHVLWNGYKKSFDVKHNQLAYVLLGIGIGIIGGTINVFTVAGKAFYPIGYLFNVLYTGIVTYAILRYRLLDITIVLKKTLSYTALFTIIIGIYLPIIYIYRQLIGESMTLPEAALLMMGATGLTVLIIFTLKERIEKGFDRLIFAGRYDYQKTLQSFGRILAITIDPDELAEKVVTGLAGIIGVEKGSMILFNNVKNGFVMKFSAGLLSELAGSVVFRKEDEIVKFLSTGKILVREEGESRSGLYKTEQRLENKILLDSIGAYVSIPIIGKAGLTGIFTLDRKASGLMYNEEDFRILSSLGYEIAIAVENAELFQTQKELIRQLVQSDKMASIGHLAAGIAHDIRNPLSAITGRIQLLLKTEGFSSEVLEDMKAIDEGAGHIAKIIENLLRLSKPSELKFGKININGVLKSAISLTEKQKFMKGIATIGQFERSLPPVSGDSAMFEQAFINLITNASEAMPDGGELNISTFSSNGMVCVEFSDTGEGIRHEDKDKLFQPFSTTKKNGVGLGLFIINNIVTAHNGRIEVHSRPGKGAKFLISLPSRIFPG